MHKSVEQFINSLHRTTFAKTLRTIDLLEQFGPKLGMPHSRRISQTISELRIRGEQEVRIFYSIRSDTAFLLHGFIKKTQKTPPREITHALRILKHMKHL